MDLVRSVHNVPIRLTGERWAHIVENHDELAGRMDDVLEAVESPAWVTRGHGGALVAWKPLGRSSYLVVVYRELSRRDGFIITAFLSTKPNKRLTLWPSRR